MKKIITLLVLLAIFTTGCSRTFVVTNVEKLETNHTQVSGYADQGIKVKETQNWTLGKTKGIDSHVFVDSKQSDKIGDLINNKPDLVVNFLFNSITMYPESIASLAAFAGELSKRNSIQLIGYTDNVGSDDVNLQLSNKRALAVKEFILEHKKLTIETEGKGLNLPIASNQTEAGRQLNRRVEVYVK